MISKQSPYIPLALQGNPYMTSTLQSCMAMQAAKDTYTCSCSAFKGPHILSSTSSLCLAGS